MYSEGGFNIKAILVLEDGFSLVGKTFAGSGEIFGELVFNTSMTGYQEIITDPSYKGQIVTMTYPHIGNYGINTEDNESSRPQLEAIVVREYCDFPSNWQSVESLKSFLNRYNIIGIEGIDTRALTLHIREKGAMKAIISTIDDDIKSLQEKVNSYPGLIGVDMVAKVSCKNEYTWNENGKYNVLAIDYGIKKSILKELEKNNCRVTVVPADTSAEKILEKDPDGIFLSNGPGDPAAVPYAVETVKELMGKKPIFGICFGHQILAQSLGLETYKLKFGHRAANHPVKDLKTQHVDISSQNHGFCVKFAEEKDYLAEHNNINTNYLVENTCPKDLEITHINLNDNTIEGLNHPRLKCFSLQYHPEAGPGPHDARHVFEDFIKLMSE
ncbi:glutamine-hydrolyzing carbamoyl-phosphate synthase small subunit [Natronospora cellulosivora (SeqCode)]